MLLAVAIVALLVGLVSLDSVDARTDTDKPDRPTKSLRAFSTRRGFVRAMCDRRLRSKRRQLVPGSAAKS